MICFKTRYVICLDSKVLVIATHRPEIDHYTGDNQFGKREFMHESAFGIQMCWRVEMSARVLRQRSGSVVYTVILQLAHDLSTKARPFRPCRGGRTHSLR